MTAKTASSEHNPAFSMMRFDIHIFGSLLFQWAKIVLVMEQTVSTRARCHKQLMYSQPMADGRRALVTRWHQTVRLLSLATY